MAQKLSEKIYEAIKKDIILGNIDVRMFLSESDIAERFGVSKAPVRDALHLLCSQGYLISYPRRGYMVDLYTAEDLRQIQEIRIHLEKLCLQLAIKNAADEDIISLREFTQVQTNQIDPEKTNNTLFHMRLAQIGKNKYLPNVLNDLLSRVSQMEITSESNLDKHNHLIDAILKRDYEKAVECLEDDIKG